MDQWRGKVDVFSTRVFLRSIPICSLLFAGVNRIYSTDFIQTFTRKHPLVLGVDLMKGADPGDCNRRYALTHPYCSNAN